MILTPQKLALKRGQSNLNIAGQKSSCFAVGAIFATGVVEHG
jgi:hypothetical protein